MPGSRDSTKVMGCNRSPLWVKQIPRSSHA
jgi:hypothetical protein